MLTFFSVWYVCSVHLTVLTMPMGMYIIVRRNHQEQWSARMRSLHVTQLMDEGKRLITAMESPHPSLKENPEFQSSLRYVRHLLKNVTEVKVKLDLLCSRLTDNFRVRKFEKEARMVSRVCVCVLWSGIDMSISCHVTIVCICR